MIQKPKVSIIIPVYNVELYIEQCINSIKAQTLYDFEAIIVDDGSQDSSIEICKRLINDDARFTILHKENGGLMSAWKYGLSHASSDYIGFVDSDDWIDPDMYNVLYSSIKENNADIVVSGYIVEGKTSRSSWSRDDLYIFEGDTIRSKFIEEYCCSYFFSKSHPSINRWDKIYRKDILLKNMAFFNEKVSLAEDFNMNIPVILDANKIVLLPNFTPYHYRFNPKSIVNTINSKAFQNIKELGGAWNKISKIKCFKSEYVDSFIGNIIFEEINRICKSTSFSQLAPETINANLELCNGYYFLKCYSHIRKTKRIDLYNWFIQHKFFKMIKILNWLNTLRK